MLLPLLEKLSWFKSSTSKLKSDIDSLVGLELRDSIQEFFTTVEEFLDCSPWLSLGLMLSTVSSMVDKKFSGKPGWTIAQKTKRFIKAICMTEDSNWQPMLIGLLEGIDPGSSQFDDDEKTDDIVF